MLLTILICMANLSNLQTHAKRRLPINPFCHQILYEAEVHVCRRIRPLFWHRVHLEHMDINQEFKRGKRQLSMKNQLCDACAVGLIKIGTL